MTYKNILMKGVYYFLALFVIVILFAVLRGLYGNPKTSDLLNINWRESGPFELSPERGRFALTYSLIEDKSYYFSINLARFVIPDLGYKDGHFVSLFAPGVSYIVIPGYLVGRILDVSQVGTYAIVALFALFNFFLIKDISKELGASSIASWLSGLIFLFATPAFAYAVNLYQHHISTFLILVSIYILIKVKKIWPFFIVWFLCALSIPVDYPNLFLMFPIGLFALSRLIDVRQLFGKARIRIPLAGLLTFLGIIFPLLFFMWFNFKSYGNPLQFSGTIAGVRAIDENGKPAVPQTADLTRVEEYLHPEEQKKSAINFFESRNLINGFYMHFLSPDRGVIVFAPIILFGIVGIYFLYRSRNKYLALLLAVLGANIILYSLWDDPWGGWAFGSRYLIPGYAIMAIFISAFLTKLQEGIWRKLLLIPFFIVFAYSIGVNSLGALTTSANPPKVEALPLEALSGKRERYSFDRNWEFLQTSGSKSFVYQTWGYKYLSAQNYYFLVAGSLVLVSGLLAGGLAISKNEKNN